MSRKISLFLLVTLLALIIPVAGMAPVQAAPQYSPDDGLYFSKTGHTLSGQFLHTWRSHGGVDFLGRPLTEPFQKAGVTFQYFERAILEFHSSDNQPIQLGLLGSIVSAGRTFETVKPFDSQADSYYFPETKHSLSDGFLTFWLEHGGLSSFGFPISEPVSEKAEYDGNVHTVQYFERARFEWIPEEAGTPFAISIARLGSIVVHSSSFDTSLLNRVDNPGFHVIHNFYGKASNFSANWDRVISLNKKWGNLPQNYKGYGLYAAMPADLDVYGHWATVYYRDKYVRVQLIDVVDWKDIKWFREQGRVIDLGREVFARLAPLDLGVIRDVYVVTE